MDKAAKDHDPARPKRSFARIPLKCMGVITTRHFLSTYSDLLSVPSESDFSDYPSVVRLVIVINSIQSGYYSTIHPRTLPENAARLQLRLQVTALVELEDPFDPIRPSQLRCPKETRLRLPFYGHYVYHQSKRLLSLLYCRGSSHRQPFSPYLVKNYNKGVAEPRIHWPCQLVFTTSSLRAQLLSSQSSPFVQYCLDLRPAFAYHSSE